MSVLIELILSWEKSISKENTKKSAEGKAQKIPRINKLILKKLIFFYFLQDDYIFINKNRIKYYFHLK